MDLQGLHKTRYRRDMSTDNNLIFGETEKVSWQLRRQMQELQK